MGLITAAGPIAGRPGWGVAGRPGWGGRWAGYRPGWGRWGWGGWGGPVAAGIVAAGAWGYPYGYSGYHSCVVWDGYQYVNVCYESYGYSYY
ncbi:hypothetical protein ABIE49_001116 [Bradyrhizobium sp. OAE829]